MRRDVRATLLLTVLIFSSCLPQEQTSTTQPSPTSKTSIAPEDKWREMARKKSPMDDSEIITLALTAEKPIEIWLGQSTPTLVIRYKEGKFEVYILTETAADVEIEDGHTVRLRVDDKPARKENWDESTDHKGLFAPNPVGLVNRMASGKTLVFEFTPFNGSPQTVIFDIIGLSKHLDEDFTDWREHTSSRKE